MKIYDKEYYEGDIKELDDIKFTAPKVVVARNINAWDIDARNIDALNIDARNINAWNIDALNIDARNINAWNIDAWDINALDLICSSRKGEGKTFCRFFAVRDHNAERKDWTMKRRSDEKEEKI